MTIKFIGTKGSQKINIIYFQNQQITRQHLQSNMKIQER